MFGLNWKAIALIMVLCIVVPQIVDKVPSVKKLLTF